MNWHQLSVDKAFDELGSSTSGLDAATITQRQQQHGPNELQEARRKTVLQMIIGQFKDFMILVLLAAAVVSGVLGELVDTLAIIIIVLVNAVLGFVQEYRAEKAMQALKQLSVAFCRVLRNGKVQKVSSVELVPGDVVLLEAGDVVPADMRLFEANALKVEEASLTGESVPSEKMVDPLPEGDIALGDRTNMVFKSTQVTYGKGIGVVVATGMNTELGRIATLLDEAEVQTPLQKRLGELGKKLAYIVLAICAVMFATGIIRGEQPVVMLLTSISLAVAAIPEALPSLVSITLAIGARRMARQQALVRNLPAVETLGSITYICSDKTGTLTENRMTVEVIFAGSKKTEINKDSSFAEPEQTLLQAMALNNSIIHTDEGKPGGDPTEVALFQAAAIKGFAKDKLLQRFPLVAELPFDSDRKCMTTVHETENDFWVITKGAADILATKLIAATTDNNIEKEAESLAADGLRVIAFAAKKITSLPKKIDVAELENGLSFLGFAGMIDPPREEVKAAIAECKAAGIRPVVITGDHPLTARTIAARLGMVADDAPALTGVDLAKYETEDYEREVTNVQVYARVSPEQKLNIVKALQAKHQFVAMTGDGVNDAPSLKRADIGVAMGITGTDVSKEAADLILLDDNFATIVKAVRSGRRIYDNIRKFIKYAMTGNTGEIWLIFLAPFFGLPIPLLPVHILWVNLVTDGLPGLALATEPAEKDIMNRPPRHPKQSIFAEGMGVHILWVGLLLGGICIAVQAYFIDSPKWQTIVFTVLCFSQMGHVLAIRSERQSLFQQGLFSNKLLLLAVLVTLLLQLATIYLPLLQPVFRTQPLTLSELGIAVALSTIVFLAVEAEKTWKRNRNLHHK